MSKNLVSVIMSCYNENIDWIKESIDSIIKQTYRNIEIIIVNDNPENEEIISLLEYYSKNEKRISIIFNDKNLGLVKSLNKAIKFAKGNYIARMDSDDVSDINRISEQVSFLEKNKDIDLVMTHANLIDEQGKNIGEFITTPCKINDIKKLLRYRNVCMHPTWLLKKSMVDKLEGYKEFLYVEDYEFLCRAIVNGYNLATIPKKLLNYRIRSTSISNSNRIQQQINFQYVNKGYIQSLKNKDVSYMNNLNIIIKGEDEFNLHFEKQIKRGKILLNNKKYIRAYILLLSNMMRNKYKRKQLINEFKYKLNLLYVNFKI